MGNYYNIFSDDACVFEAALNYNEMPRGALTF
jgi:hypothetical protein